jgi:cytochrome bd ubiquinol oxidase subunit II
MTLETFWFIVIALLWTGFFVLEGFDLGVGMLHGILGKDEAGRRAAINTIGPLWDGNEVWLIVAAAAMFAAFPSWYATMFSGFYVVIVLLLVALIARGVSFEFRGKQDSPRWRRTWDALMTGGSLLVPLLIGFALADLLYGVPIDKDQEFTGSMVDLVNPYAVLFAVTLLLLCVLQGATFLSLKTTGELEERARVLARRTAPVASVVMVVLIVWTHIIADRGVDPNPLQFVAVIAALAATWLLRERASGWAFAATSVAIASTVLSFFVDLYPRLMVSSTNTAYSLTVQNSASGSYALKVMTVVTVILFPTVLIYQGWTYHVFRERVRTDDFAVPEDAGTGSSGDEPAIPAARPPA